MDFLFAPVELQLDTAHLLTKTRYIKVKCSLTLGNASNGADTTIFCSAANASYYSCVRFLNGLDSVFLNFILEAVAMRAKFGTICQYTLPKPRNHFYLVTLPGSFKSQIASVVWAASSIFLVVLGAKVNKAFG